MNLIQVLEITFKLEATACIFKNCQSHEEFIIFLIYRNKQNNIQYFFEQLYLQLSEFALLNLRIILLGYFNLDPWKNDNNPRYYIPIQQAFELHMKSNFSTHIHAGVLDLIFDTDSQRNHAWEWLPTPFSDHFIIFYGL